MRVSPVSSKVFKPEDLRPATVQLIMGILAQLVVGDRQAAGVTYLLDVPK